MPRAASSLKAADATCTEVPPDSAEAKRHNEENVTLSSGLIPPLLAMKCLSIGGGHTNTFLRQVLAGVRCVVARLQDDRGNLSYDKLTQGRPEFKRALDEGLEWFIIHWPCEQIWPDLVRLVQSALNTEARTTQGEVEIMLFMHEEAMRAISNGKEPDWKRIEEAAAFSLPLCRPYLSDMAGYVKVNAGGVQGELLKELSMFVKMFASADHGPLRALGGEFIAKVTSLKWPNLVRLPYVQNACFETNLSSAKVVDGICRLLLPAHATGLQALAKLPMVKEAEQMMAQARAVCDSVGATFEQRVRLAGTLDVRCICHITGKSKEHEGVVYKSLNDIAEVPPCTCH